MANPFGAIGQWVQDQFDPEDRAGEEAKRQARIARGRAALAASSAGRSGNWQDMLNATGALQAQHFGNHANMVAGTQNAIATEMDRRVHISREMRRMQHEKELAAMKIQNTQAEQEGALIRALLSGR